MALFAVTLLTICETSRAQIAYDGIILGRANRWDSYPTHLFFGGKHTIWWGSQGANFKDVIYRSQKTSSLGPGGWSAPTQVFSEAQSAWAVNHTADPSVIRGSFPYNGTTYAYVMFFTSDRTGIGGGTDNSIGVAFSNDGISWVSPPNPVVVPAGGSTPGYGAGMSGVAYHPTTGKLQHVFLDSTLNPAIRLNETTTGLSLTPQPALATQLHTGGRQGNDGQGPDIAYSPADGHWYAAIKCNDPQGIYDGETRVLRSTNPGDLLGGWEVLGIFNSSVTGFQQNQNPGLGKNADGTLYLDGQGWGYVFFGVGAQRPAVTTWEIAQGRFRPYFNLSVGRVGVGSGAVTSNPAGINCGSDCSERLKSGTVVTLVATAAAGSTFIGWTGDADCTDGTVTLLSARNCIAQFDSLVKTKVLWIQPQPLAGFGPPGSLVMAGSATGAAAGSGVQMRWRNLTTGGAWVTEAYTPVPDGNGIWFHSIPNANYAQLYEVSVTYGGITSVSCTYQGNNAFNACP